MNALRTPALRACIGLVLMTIGLLLVAQSLGLLPDETKSEFSARINLAGALSVQLAGTASRSNKDVLQEAMDSVVARGIGVISVALRKADRTILIKSGDHEVRWVDNPSGISTPTHVQVPIVDAGELWGRVEIVFPPLQAGFTSFGIPKSLVVLIAFIGVCEFAGYFVLLRRTLREIDPSNVIPERIRTAFDTMAEGILVVDEKGTIVLVNNAFQSAFKDRGRTLIGARANALGCTDWESGALLADAPWERASRTGQRQTGASVCLEVADGIRRRFVVNAGPILDRKRRVRGSIATFNDVTELDQKNEALASVVSQLQDFSARLEERVAERTVEAEQAAAQALQANQRLTEEIRVRRQAEASLAEQRDVLIRQQSALSSITSQGNLAGSDWRRSLERLTEACADALGASRIAIWLGPGDARRLECTELYVAASGTHASGDILSEADFPQLLAAFSGNSTLAAEDSQSDPLTREHCETYLAPSGCTSLRCVPLLQEAQCAGLLTVEHCSEDRGWSPESQMFATAIANLASFVIESRQRLAVEADLRTTNTALEQASRAKSDFLANMSHEIRTPMNGVFGMTDLLLRTELTSRQLRFVNTIQQSAKALLVIINDILDISRIERGKLEIDSHEFDLGNCVEDAALLIAEEAQRKGLAFNLFVDERASRTVTGDSGRLRQVILNLLGNAIKFTSSGSIGLSVRSVATGDGTETFRFEIADTGIGIAPDILKRLFRPFVQADSSVTRRFGGTGLGLSISRHLVSMMGGELGIESTLGQGTRIWFVLPMTFVKAQDARRPRSTLRDRRVLVFERSEGVRETVAAYLTAAGACVDTAATAADARHMIGTAAAEERPYALAIAELVSRTAEVPEAFDIEAAREAGLAPSCVVMLASLSADASVRDHFESAGVRIIHKPIRRIELIDAVSALLTAEPRAEHTAHDEGASPMRKSLGLNVLVAEDNPVNQTVAAEYLDNLGCTYALAEDGAAALRLAAEQKFDLVLMDVQMPVMDGLTAAREIRKREREHELSPIPIVAVTANAFDTDRKASAAAGMNHYLSKPYSEAQLADCLIRSTSAREASGTAPVRASASAGNLLISSLHHDGMDSQRPATPCRAPASPLATDKPDSGAAASTPAAYSQSPVAERLALLQQRLAGLASRPGPAAQPAAEPLHRSCELKPAAAPDTAPASHNAEAGAAAASPQQQPAFRQRLLRIYLEYAPKAVGSIVAALEKSDTASLRQTAHSFKSGSGNIGAERTSALCLALERAADTGEIERCRPIVADIERQHERDIVRLRAELAGRAQASVA